MIKIHIPSFNRNSFIIQLLIRSALRIFKNYIQSLILIIILIKLSNKRFFRLKFVPLRTLFLFLFSCLLPIWLIDNFIDNRMNLIKVNLVITNYILKHFRSLFQHLEFILLVYNLHLTRKFLISIRIRCLKTIKSNLERVISLLSDFRTLLFFLYVFLENPLCFLLKVNFPFDFLGSCGRRFDLGVQFLLFFGHFVHWFMFDLKHGCFRNRFLFLLLCFSLIPFAFQRFFIKVLVLVLVLIFRI